MPAYRWSVDDYYSPDATAPGKMRCRFGSFLGPVEDFDCQFFRMSKKEAECLDPQQRLLLELSCEAIADAGLAKTALAGSRTGVFIGQSGFDFAVQHTNLDSLNELTPYVGSGCSFAPAAGRIAFFHDFHGPAYVLDTACSSSLVAVHNACRSLQNGDCDLALVGAANLILSPAMTINFDKLGLLAPDGRIQTFDAAAHGFVRGEGAGMIILKKLPDALRDGDRLDGLILSSAINEDGSSNSLMSPNGLAQVDVIRQTLQGAGITPDDMDFLETHGTATPAGDPMELNALADVFATTTRRRPLRIGSVKTNFGHLEAGAGMLGICKLLLSMRHNALPPHLNFEHGTAEFDWSSGCLEVNRTLSPWARSDRPRIAGISGFGFAGTNAHIILAEPPLTGSAGRPRLAAPVFDRQRCWSAAAERARLGRQSATNLHIMQEHLRLMQQYLNLRSTNNSQASSKTDGDLYGH
ncbi:acyl transferase domain-containing protein [Oligosphaera ethanolica]|uniref:Acyl transferase domain-containing protein n=1 Tax=Oligosphaera ethanolica TaxID=760260 RepID=A0AAE4AND2_9BACT|nr:acyl transferase domain-containing protein [Oligosphaera ethanolica]